MSDSQRTLVEMLARKGERATRPLLMYHESLRAAERRAGPEDLHVAAYELREMMNALPVALDVPIANTQNLQYWVEDLLKKWKHCLGQSACRKSGEWKGAVDNVLGQFLGHVEGFFVSIEIQAPEKRAQAELMLQALSLTPQPVNKPLMDRRTRQWKRLLRFFNAYTHHNVVPALANFHAKRTELEALLLDHLVLRTFADQDEIDRLIGEVEGA